MQQMYFFDLSVELGGSYLQGMQRISAHKVNQNVQKGVTTIDT